MKKEEKEWATDYEKHSQTEAVEEEYCVIETKKNNETE